METDNIHLIGFTHDECQDYSLSGEINPHLSYAIVTDGCSSSHNISRSVDIGSRIVAHAAKVSLMEQFEFFDGPFSGKYDLNTIGETIKRRVIDYILIHKNLLKIDDYYADCTLLIALMDVFGNAVVFYSGDGAFTFKCGEQLVFNQIEFSKNAPYYISYSTDLNRETSYMRQFYGQTMTILSHYSQEGLVSDQEQSSLVKDVSNIANTGIINNVDIVSVLSDGYKSFIADQSPEIVSGYDSLIEFNSFKHLKGQFVNRRVRAAMKKLGKDNFRNYDDFSMAAIAKL